jgi:ABC-type lipoprotein release transport system permease subunit
MKTIIIIAWRNIWRNKRRSIITIAAIFMAVLLSVFMRSMQLGQYEMMIEGGVNQVGYIQIHNNGYWDNQSINKAMILTAEMEQKIKEVENVKEINPKFMNFGLASSGEQTKASMITGIQPEKEDNYTGLSRKVIWGDYLSKTDNGILVAENLAVFLKLAEVQKDTIFNKDGEISIHKEVTMLEDSLVIISSGYQGISAYGLFPIRGIVSLPTPMENNRMIYMSLPEAQYTFSPFVPNLTTAVALDLLEPEKMEETKAELVKILGDKYEVMTWEEMLTEIVQGIQMDNAGGILMLGVLYIIVGFGLFGTIIMITMERRKEMAVMLSIGMQRGKILSMVIAETIILGLSGVFVGELLSWPFIYYLFINPIPMQGEMAAMMETYNMEPFLPFSMNPDIFINQGITVLIISIVVAIYPIIKILKLKPVDAR